MLFGIYYRKLIFFGLIGLLIWGGVQIRSVVKEAEASREVTASVADNINMSDREDFYFLELDLKEDGSLYIRDEKIAESVKALADREELRYIVMNESGEFYPKAEIVVNLPKKINRLVEDPEIIAVHGATAKGAFLEGRKLTYRAVDVGPSSTVTIVGAFPAGYFDLPTTKKVSQSLQAVPGLLWLVGGLLLPLIAAGITFFMIYKAYFFSLSRGGVGELSVPPEGLPPAVASVLVGGRVSARSLMAVLVDLAQRGYLDIYNRGDDFVIYRKVTTSLQQSQLKDYELVLLDKIFLPRQRQVGALDVEARLGRHLFSRKIAFVYLGIYEEARSLGYFDELPSRYHLKFRLIGIASFFAGLFGYGIFAIFSPDPKYVLFFWLSLVLFGMLMVNLASRLSVFSPRGAAVREALWRFRNYLSRPQMIRGRDYLFEKYLPYAVALSCEGSWAARFAEASLIKPRWYDYAGAIGGVESFAKTLLPIIDQIGASFDLASDPLVQ